MPKAYDSTSATYVVMLAGVFCFMACAGDLPADRSTSSSGARGNGVTLGSTPPVASTPSIITPTPAPTATPTTTETDASAVITRFYLESLGRAPDTAGFNHYLNQAQGGRALSEIGFEIANSPEAKIRQMYLSHLLREPDTGGMAYWLGCYAGGQTLQEIQDNIRRSTECLSNCLR